MLGESVTIGQALKVTGLSMGVVFAALFAICQMLELFRVFFYKKESAAGNAKAAGSQYESKDGDSGYIDISNPQSEEEIAVVAAASVIFSDASGERDIRIKSIRKIA